MRVLDFAGASAHVDGQRVPAEEFVGFQSSCLGSCETASVFAPFAIRQCRAFATQRFRGEYNYVESQRFDHPFDCSRLHARFAQVVSQQS